MLHALFFINGIYDILCAACILGIVDIPVLRELHVAMFIEKNPTADRFLAYWIFTYGVIRMFGNNMLISTSYFIEALFFFNELARKNVYKEKTFFVIGFCIILGFLAALTIYPICHK